MIREVTFLSQAGAEAMRPLPREGIISITGSGYPPATLRRGWRRVLRLVFDDVEIPFFGAIHFDTVHAEAILRWLDEVEGKVDKVYREPFDRPDQQAAGWRLALVGSNGGHPYILDPAPGRSRSRYDFRGMKARGLYISVLMSNR